MSATFSPTPEQEQVVELARRGGDLKIKAYAGAGKTSTLNLVADRFGARRGIYLAFNRDIAAAAARKFPPHVPARTMHAHAWAAADSALKRRSSLEVEPPHILAARFGIGAVQVRSVTGRAIELTPFETGRMITDALGRFCRSSESQPIATHVVVDEKIDVGDAAQLQTWLLPFVQRMWEESAGPRAGAAVSPDVVLKLWALSEPRIEADYILFDEAQDSDGVMLSVLERQRHAQVIYVGDPYQQIYEWRGAVNAMAQIDAPECALTESFRFGPTFAALASRLLVRLGERTPLRGQDSIGSILVEDPAIAPPVDAVLCRKNVTAIWQLAAGLKWVTDSHSMDPMGELEERKAAFNANRSIDDQSQNWKVGGLGGFAILREETPNEARIRLGRPESYEANNYHSGVLHSAENHRWVTAMDVAIGQAVTLDDPVWGDLLVRIADWKLTKPAMNKITGNANYRRLPADTSALIDACAAYYQNGDFPDGLISDLPPSLVTSELTPKASAAQQQAIEQQRAADERFYQNQAAQSWGTLGGG
ncbi:effector protein Tle3 domain-containing protein [Paraburkholderia tropica]|uniref:effector protein Tle3 domain-containing protein n=1 Tax=Paraburkholderia tropica TaxID=92647 RepID=UPI002AB28504|nr:DUF3274 domain-containing protein [Paraburkholderia tropica]